MPHGHGLAIGLYIIAWGVLAKYVADVVTGAFANSTAARALHQSV